MKEITFSHWLSKYKKYLTNSHYWLAVFLSLCFLVISLLINSQAGQFATRSESNPLTDVVLSNTRVYNLDDIFIYGGISLSVCVGLLCVIYPDRAPYTLRSVALFTIIRSVFISLTHIAPFPGHAVIDPTSFINHFTFDGDLFFSGHTGLPFLLALLFWDNKFLRYLFIATSIFLGITVLLAHLHYSIDVLAAYFITYSIYRLSEILFTKKRYLNY